MNNGVTTTIQIRKTRIDPDQRMNAKALLLAHFPQLMGGGQLIIHFGPGRSPIWVEVQERVDHVEQQLKKVG